MRLHRVNILKWAIPALLAAVAPAQGALAADDFTISGTPTRGDWQEFFRLTEAGRQRIWTWHSGRGRHLRDWSWEWRLGWVRACTGQESAWCRDVIRQGLQDRAVVVRGRAASALGHLHAGTGDTGVLAELEATWKNPRNFRRGKPLAAAYRILEAIWQVEGRAREGTGPRLAAGLPAARDYWQKLTRSL